MATATPGLNSTNPVPTDNWEAAFLKTLQQQSGVTIPNTLSNQALLAAWAQSEGVIGNNNPLASGGVHPGATSCLAQCGTSSAIMAYATLQDGIDANVNFLVQNDYGPIIQAFSQSQDSGQAGGTIGIDVTSIERVWAAINQSGWCRGCQGGQYPEAVFALWNNPSTQGSVTSELNNVANLGTAATGAVTAGAKAVAGAASWTTSLGNLLGDITKTSFWVRIGLGLLGAILIITGLVFILSETKAGQVAATAAVAAA